MDNGNEKLPLRERLELAKRSQASSPEAAVGLVKRFSEVHTATFFAESADSGLMYELTDAYWDPLGEDLFHYSGFCRCIRMALEDDFEPPADPTGRAVPLSPIWGKRVSNALVLLGLMLMDHARGKRRDKTIYRCTRMTLGQYLEALEALAFTDEDAAPGRRFRIWREEFMKSHDRSAPLADVLADILRRYMAAWQVFDRLEHLLRCMGALACYLENVADEPLGGEEAERVRHFRETLYMYAPNLEGWELLEEDKRYPDPGGYFFCMANEYPDDMPDPGDKELPARAIRRQIYISRGEYETGLLPLLADLSPSPDLGALLRRYGDAERLTSAMAEIHTAVSELYMLWVEPYLAMEELRGGGHRGKELLPG